MLGSGRIKQRYWGGEGKRKWCWTKARLARCCLLVLSAHSHVWPSQELLPVVNRRVASSEWVTKPPELALLVLGSGRMEIPTVRLTPTLDPTLRHTSARRQPDGDREGSHNSKFFTLTLNCSWSFTVLSFATWMCKVEIGRRFKVQLVPGRQIDIYLMAHGKGDSN